MFLQVSLALASECGQCQPLFELQAKFVASPSDRFVIPDAQIDWHTCLLESSHFVFNKVGPSRFKILLPERRCFVRRCVTLNAFEGRVRALSHVAIDPVEGAEVA